MSLSPQALPAALLAVAALTLATPALAAPLVVGSGNEAVIEPNVPHPNETPCVVPLATAAVFTSYTPVPISFTPPAACPGPWARIVLGIGISLNHGRQFDRTGTIFLGNIPLWFGTTAEPRATLAPNWHFERDVTDDTALFTKPQAGSILIANIVDSTYTGIITANATLSFYPATAAFPAPRTADVVLPLSTSGQTVALNTPTDQLTTTTTLPRNILQARLDLFLQGQSGDEFWYTCVPSSLAGELDSCGGGALREGEVSVDGTPAGVAPVYPWIFTGGIDPYLWQPIPGVQTFNFKPYAVDLSPFAGLLSNGKPHSIATSVYGANGFFSTTGALLLFLDHGASHVTGKLTADTLAAAPTVKLVNHLTGSVGTLNTIATHDFTISGFVRGSAGTIVSTVHQTTSFANDQDETVSATQDRQVVRQVTDIASVSTTRIGNTAATITKSLHWPLTVAYNYVVEKSDASHQFASVTQQDIETDIAALGIATLAQSTTNEGIQTQDTLYYDAAGNFIGHLAQAETASYLSNSTANGCFGRTLSAVNNVLTAVNTGC